MSLRISLVLVIVVSFVGIALTWVIKNPPIGGADEEDLPFFYTLSPDDIRRITVETPRSQETFFATYEEEGNNLRAIWFFEEPSGIPVNFDRWGGVTFLLGGPKTQRVLRESFEDPAEYGLDRPTTRVSLTLRDGSVRTLMLGSSTPDGGAHYAQMVGFPQLVLVDSSWGQVLSRLADEPPLPQWYYTFETGQAHEVLFYEENDVVRGLSFDDETGEWILCTIPIVGDPCEGTVRVDATKFISLLETIANPRFTKVEKVARNIEEAKHEAYGLDLQAPYITVRIEEVNERGITEVTFNTLTLGKLTPDGSEMYVLANEQPTVARVEADWGQRVKALFDDTSFVPQSATSAR